MAANGITGSGNGPTIIIQNCTVHIHISPGGAVRVETNAEPPEQTTEQALADGETKVDRSALRRVGSTAKDAA